MKTIAKLGVLVAVAAVGAAIAWNRTPQKEAPQAAPSTSVQKPIPKLVDLGAGKCIPCKAMAPILEQLRVDYAGRLEVQFIDVWKNPEAGEQHAIRTIPTQIFYAADGRELARHEGFIDREQILIGFRAGSTAPGYAALLIGLFGIGHAGVIAIAGAFGESVQRWLNWSAGSKGSSAVRFTAGVLVIVAGLYFLYTAR